MDPFAPHIGGGPAPWQSPMNRADQFPGGQQSQWPGQTNIGTPNGANPINPVGFQTPPHGAAPFGSFGATQHSAFGLPCAQPQQSPGLPFGAPGGQYGFPPTMPQHAQQVPMWGQAPPQVQFTPQQQQQQPWQQQQQQQQPWQQQQQPQQPWQQQQQQQQPWQQQQQPQQPWQQQQPPPPAPPDDDDFGDFGGAPPPPPPPPPAPLYVPHGVDPSKPLEDDLFGGTPANAELPQLAPLPQLAQTRAAPPQSAGNAPPFDFGATAAPAAPAFDFGGAPAGPATPSFDFGAPPAAAAPLSQVVLGAAAPATPSTPAFDFGGPAAPAAASAFDFGAPSVTAAPTPPFDFGQAAAAHAAAPEPAFDFGAPASSTSPAFGFGVPQAAPGGASPSFDFGGGSAAASTPSAFDFGGGAAAVPTAVPTPSAFDFSAPPAMAAHADADTSFGDFEASAPAPVAQMAPVTQTAPLPALGESPFAPTPAATGSFVTGMAMPGFGSSIQQQPPAPAGGTSPDLSPLRQPMFDFSFAEPSPQDAFAAPAAADTAAVVPSLNSAQLGAISPSPFSPTPFTFEPAPPPPPPHAAPSLALDADAFGDFGAAPPAAFDFGSTSLAAPAGDGEGSGAGGAGSPAGGVDSPIVAADLFGAKASPAQASPFAGFGGSFGAASSPPQMPTPDIGGFAIGGDSPHTPPEATFGVPSAAPPAAFDFGAPQVAPAFDFGAPSQPAFDFGAPVAAPAFDFGGSTVAPASHVFDSSAAAGAPPFDFGADAQPAPTFDLGPPPPEPAHAHLGAAFAKPSGALDLGLFGDAADELEPAPTLGGLSGLVFGVGKGAVALDADGRMAFANAWAGLAEAAAAEVAGAAKVWAAVCAVSAADGRAFASDQRGRTYLAAAGVAHWLAILLRGSASRCAHWADVLNAGDPCSAALARVAAAAAESDRCWADGGLGAACCEAAIDCGLPLPRLLSTAAADEDGGVPCGITLASLGGYGGVGVATWGSLGRVLAPAANLWVQRCASGEPVLPPPPPDRRG